MKEFTFRLKADVSYLEEQFKGGAEALKALAIQADKADDKLQVLKQVGAYVGQMDAALAKVQKKYPNLFDEIFGDVNKQITEALSPLKKMPEEMNKILSKSKIKLDSLIADPGAATVSEIKEIGDAFKAVAKAMGNTSIDFKFLDGSSRNEAKIKKLVKAMRELEESYFNVNKVVSSEVENVVTPTKKSKAPKKTKKEQSINTMSYDALLKTVKEAKELSKAVYDGDDDAFDKLDNKMAALEKVFKLSEEEVAQLDVILQDLDDDIDATMNKLQKLLGDQFPSISDSVGEPIVNEQDIKNAAAVSENVDKIGVAADDATLKLDVLEDKLNDIVRNASKHDLEFSVVLNGEDVTVRRGKDKTTTDIVETAGNMMSSLGKYFVDSHTHTTTSKITDDVDLKAFARLKKYGVTNHNAIFGPDGVTAYDFSQVSDEDMQKAIEMVEELRKSGVVTNEELSNIFKNLNSSYDVVKHFDVDNIGEFAKYIDEVTRNAQASVDPLKQFQGIVDYLTGGRVDWSKYNKLLEGFTPENAKNIFDQIVRTRTGDEVDIYDFDKKSFADAVSGIANVNQKLKEQEDLYQQVRAAIKGTLEEVVGMDFTAVALEDIEREIKDGLITTLEEAIARFKEMNNLTDDVKISAVGDNQHVAYDWEGEGNTYVGYGETVVKEEEFDALKQAEQNAKDAAAEVENLRGEVNKLHQEMRQMEDGGSYDHGYEQGYNDGVSRSIELQDQVEKLQLELADARQRVSEGSQIGDSFGAESEAVKTNIQAEIDELERLEIAIAQVEQAIKDKTAAFYAEGQAVRFNVEDELTQLELLRKKLNDISYEVSEIGKADIKTPEAKNDKPQPLDGEPLNGDQISMDIKETVQDTKELDIVEQKVEEITNEVKEHEVAEQKVEDAVNQTNNAIDEQLSKRKQLLELSDTQKYVDFLNERSKTLPKDSIGYGYEENIETIANGNILKIFNAFKKQNRSINFIGDGEETRIRLASIKEMLEQIGYTLSDPVFNKKNGLLSAQIIPIDGQAVTDLEKARQILKDIFVTHAMSFGDGNVGVNNRVEEEKEVSAAVDKTNDKLDEQIAKKEKLVGIDLSQQQGTFNFLEKELKGAESFLGDEEKEAYEQLLATVQMYKKSKEKIDDAEIDRIREIVKGYKTAADVKKREIEATEAQASATNKVKETQDKLNKSLSTKKADGQWNNAKASSIKYANSSIVQENFAIVEQAYTALQNAKQRYADRGTELSDQEQVELDELVRNFSTAYGKLNKIVTDSEKLSGNKGKVFESPVDPAATSDMAKLEQAMRNAVNAATGGKAKFEGFNKTTGELAYKLADGAGKFDHFKVQIDSTGTKLVGLNAGLKKTNGFLRDIADSTLSKMKSAIGNITGYDLIYRLVNVTKQGIQYIRDIDSALTELKKVTDETEESYAEFLQTASKTAKVVGSTVKDITTMTAEWARLGYSMQEAASLAESTAVLLNVSEFSDATEASEALISTIQAYGYAANESMDVVNVLNEVGNNFAVSSNGLATALQTSASALMAAGNDLNQSVALVAAANKVLQDPSVAGAALRTIALRIRGTSLEVLEEMGEETDGVIESVSKLQEKVKAISGVDILDDSGAYRDTYEILKDLAEVWEEIGQKDPKGQAALLELLAGKNRSNALAAILTNLEDLEGAYDAALQSEGSAQKELDTYLNSIEGRIDQFTNAVQTMWMNAISSDQIKWFVDVGTSIVNILDGMVRTIKPIPTLFTLAAAAFGLWKGAPKLLSTVIKSASGLGAAIKAVRVEQAAYTAAQTASNIVTGSQLANLVAVSNAKISDAGITWLATQAEEAVTVAKIKSAMASGVLSKADGIAMLSTMGLAGSVKALWAAFLASPLAPVIAALGALAVVIGVIDATTTSFKEAKEQLKETSEELETTRSEIKSLNDELKTTQERIDELNGKDTLTIAEQEELDRLMAQNAELERQIRLEEQREKILAKQQASDLHETMEKDSSMQTQTFTTTEEDGTRITTTIDPAADRLTSQYEQQKQMVEDAQKALEEAQAEYDKVAGTDQEGGSWWNKVFGTELDPKNKLEAAEKALENAKNMLATTEQDIAEQLKHIEETYGSAEWQYGDNLEPWQEALNEDLEVIYEAQYKLAMATDETGQIAEDAFNWVAGRDDVKKSRNSLTELLDIYNAYTQALQDVKDKEIDLSKTQHGNIDLANRQKIVWTEELIEQYKQALLDWAQPIDEMLGMTSTVIGSADTYDGLDIAFSPMLQTENGAVLLTRDAVDKYIYAILDKAKEGDGQFTTEELLALDASGIEIDGQHIKGLIADIGEEAIATSEAMHYIGESGEIDLIYNALESAASEAGTTAEQIIAAFENNNFTGIPGFEEFIQELIEVGFIADDTPESIQKVVDAFNAAEEAALAAAAATDEAGSGLSETLGSLSKFEEGMGDLSDIYNEFIDNGSATAASLAGIAETFDVDGLSDEYEALVRVLGDSTSTADEAKTAIENLASAYLNSLDLTSDVVEEDITLIVSSLEKLGIVNAEQLVRSKVEAYEAVLEVYGVDLKNYSTLEEAKAAVLAAMLSQRFGITADQVNQLSEKYDIDLDNFTGTEAEKVKAAKDAARQIAEAYKVERLSALDASLDKKMSDVDSTGTAGLRREKELTYWYSNEKKRIENEFNSMVEEVEKIKEIDPNDYVPEWYKAGDILDMDKFSKIGDNSKEDALSELDWIDHYFTAIDNRIAANEAKLEDTLANVANIVKRNDIINSIIADYKKKIPQIEDVIDEYSLRAQQLYNSFSPDIQKKINSGSLKISEYDDELADQIQTYFDYIGQKSDWEIELANLNITIDDYELQKFNNVVEAYENELNLEADFSNRVQAQIDLLEEQGERVSEELYEAMIKGTKTQLVTLREERARLQNQLNAAMANGIEKGSPQWYEMVTAINDVDAAIIEAETSIESFNNAIQDLHWEAFDKLIDRISSVADEAENLRDLLDTEKVLKNNFAEGYLDGLTELDKKLKDGKISVDEYTKEYDELAKTFKDAYGWTDDGVTALSLLTQEMENAKYRSNLYAKEIEDLTANYKSLGYSEDEYQEKLQELKEGQWDAIDAYESAKDAVMDLNEARVEEIKDGIQKQIDAYEKLIEKQKESLQQQREQHELAKEDKEYEDQVAAIQRKIRAMENDTSASSIAQQKLLRAELAELEEERRETEYERDMDVKEQALDDSLDLYTEGKEALMDAWDEYLTHEEQVMADSYANITNNVDNINKTIRDLSEQYGIEISDAVTQPWEDAQLALDDYSSKFETATSTYITKLGTIKSSLESLETQANKTAQAFLAMLEAQAMEVPEVNLGSGGGSGKDPTAGIGTPSWGPGDPDYDSWAGTGVKPSQNSSASISKGQSVTVSTSATNFSSKSGNASMASFVKGGSYTVMQTSGNQVLIGKNGVATGWVNKSDLNGYAKGTTGVSKNELAWVDENGLEEIVMHAQNGRLAYLTKGSSVIPHDISENLMELGKVDPKTWLDNNRPNSVPASFVTQNNNIDLKFASLINIEHADRDSIPEIKDAVQKQLDSYMKTINNGIKRYSR